MNTQYAHAASSCVPCPGRHRGSNECESSPRPTLNSSRFPYARLFVGVLIGLFCKIYAACTTYDRAAFPRTNSARAFLLPSRSSPAPDNHAGIPAKTIQMPFAHCPGAAAEPRFRTTKNA
ncbi:hypothetical protein QCE73_27140 [Caballeronia sp. LZ029]|uniref:hypothetical protein n=1 Tax=Caballeronia sp. LZ029 TaxID=3038564 RepID=UPI00285A8F53|nr:hypothetical protein [Caballeronia sp. LZ029]MDR5746852.1 hypothetical protein [Caballeronia sp. LZ029]